MPDPIEPGGGTLNPIQAGLALTLLLGTLVPSPAAARQTQQEIHLTGTYPAADSTHAEAISEIRLRFSGQVQPKLTAITLLGPGGSLPPTGPARAVPSSGGEEVSVRFAHPLTDGAYTVEWRTAGLDGRVVRGGYVFSVALPPPPAAASDSSGSARAPGAAAGTGTPPAVEFGPGGLTVNWLFLLSIVGMIGTVAFRLGVAAPLGRREELGAAVERITRRLARLAWAFAIIGVVALPLRLGYQAALLSGPDDGLLAAAGSLLGSLWGSAWLLELASVALFLVAILLMGPSSRIGPWGLALSAAVLGAVVPGLSGHAAVGGPKLVALNTLHVLAAGTWAGGLACLVLAGIPAANAADPEASALSAVVGAFSRMALPAVAVLVLSGVLNALSHLTFGELLSTSYGRLLLAKLIVVLGAFSLGFYNWRMVRPALEGQSRPGLLSVPATLELVVALAVLAVTAGLAVAALP